MLGALLALAMFAGTAAPSNAAGVVVLANGGSYFSAHGPSQYWRFDWNEGWCGKYAGWCSPRHFQWTYVVRQFGAENYAIWRVPDHAIVSYANRAFAFIPRRNATATVEYDVYYAYNSRGKAIVDQMAYYDQWAPLVPSAGANLYRIHMVTLGDNTWWGSGSQKVAFDEIKIEN
jgi:hypothetical protein